MKKIEFGNIGALSLAVALALGLTACGGDDAFDGSTTNTTDTTDTTGAPSSGAVTGTAVEIAVSYPVTNALEDLQNGFYRRIAAVMVTDRDGNAVPDGTIVNLNVIDSVIAEGTINTGDSITGNTLTDAGVTIGDGITTTTMDMAAVLRHGQPHTIESGDRVFLFNPDVTAVNADAADVSRIIDRNSITNTSINVSTAYVGSYPNTTYPAGNTKYIIGASLLGAEVSGVDSSGNLTTGASATVNGIAEFKITYPANVGTINSGCGDVPDFDARISPQGSGRVFVVASVAGNPAVTAVSDDFCFVYMADGTLGAVPESLSAPGSISVQFRDGGDTVRVPFARIYASLDNSGGAGVTLDVPAVGYYRTNSSGYITATVLGDSGVSGKTADITFTAGGEPDVKITVKYKIP